MWNLLPFGICRCQSLYVTNLFSYGFVKVHSTHRRRRQGGWGELQPSHLWKILQKSDNRPKVGQNVRKQWIFYRAAPLNFISPYAYERVFIFMIDDLSIFPHEVLHFSFDVNRKANYQVDF